MREGGGVLRVLYLTNVSHTCQILVVAIIEI